MSSSQPSLEPEIKEGVSRSLDPSVNLKALAPRADNVPDVPGQEQVDIGFCRESLLTPQLLCHPEVVKLDGSHPTHTHREP